jgi:hypothetical protein
MSERPLPRVSLACLAILHALPFALAAVYLPWPHFSVFTGLSGLLALGHLATAGLAIANSAKRGLAWRLTSLLALGFLGYFTYASLGSGLYINALYDGVGTALLAASAAAWCVGALFLLPFSLWGIAATGGLLRKPPARGPGGGAAVAAGVVLLGISAGIRVSSAHGTARVAEPPQAIDDVLREVLADLPAAAEAKRTVPSLFVAAASKCPARPHEFKGTTLYVTYLDGTSSAKEAPAVSECLQAASVREAATKARDILAEKRAAGEVVIDIVTRSRELPAAGMLLGPIVVVPGLEGVCSGPTCLLPWQLFGLDAFTDAANISALQAEIGVTATGLRKLLAVEGDSFLGLDAFRTRTLVLGRDGSLTPYQHMRTARVEPDSDNVQRALRDAAQFIVSSQVKDGRYRYTVQPFNGQTSFDNFSVPRQAGTTFALCDAARFNEKAKASAKASLAFLVTLLQSTGEVGGIVFPKGRKTTAGLGSSALTTVALLGCREVVGNVNDAAIEQLVRGILLSQREDGSFRPAIDPREGTPVEGKDALYASGQAVLALVMWEGPLGEGLTRPPGLKEAIDKAMNHYAGPYWDIPLRDFFYLEENWHCLAARAALTHHRHDAYERFCIDYMTMKKRFIQRPGSGVDPDHVGSYAFGHVFPPHHAAAGGFAEGLAAAMKLKKARGQSTADDEAVMKLVLGLLVHHQWRDVNCFMCTRKLRIPGGFSENAASPTVRIDFVQHNMAALLHGGELLGWVPPAE